MKMIIKIAQYELRILFCSPIAWLILIIFSFQLCTDFTAVVGMELKSKAEGYRLANETARIFSGYRGLFSSLQKYLYLYIPLLTMGIMSREYSSGSIKLLFSSPIKNKDIVLGKYLALIFYGMILMVCLAVVSIVGIFLIKSPDIPLILCGMLALFLLMSSYAAIGLFASSLTHYQVVAAVGTLAVFAALDYMGNIGQEIAFVRDITYWLSISGRANELINGLICSEDIIYFFVVISLFISLTILRLNVQKTKQTKTTISIKYIVIILIAFSIGYLSSRPAFMTFYDSTRTKSQTLTKNSQEIMKKLNGPLSLTTYVNLLDEDYIYSLLRSYNNDVRRFRQYIRFKPETKINYVYYYAPTHNPRLKEIYPNKSIEAIAKNVAYSNKLNFNKILNPEQIKEVIDLEKESHRFIRVFDRPNGQQAFLRNYNDMSKHPSETEISATLKTLVSKSPKIRFSKGNGEREIFRTGDREYSIFASDKAYRNSLVNQGFETDVIDIKNEIPQDVDVLVIADRGSDLNQIEKLNIINYLENGGNLVLATKPQSIEYIQEIMDYLGLQFINGTIVNSDENYAPDLIFGNITGAATNLSSNFSYLYWNNYKITSPGTSGILFKEDKNFQLLPIIITDSLGCWNELETENLTDSIPDFNPEAGERYLSQIPIILAMQREKNKKHQKIIVSGNADIFSNGELRKNRDGIKSGNFTLITEIFRWFTNGEFPVDTSRRYGPDNEIKLTFSDVMKLKILLIIFLPVLLSALGIRKLFKRQRK